MSYTVSEVADGGPATGSIAENESDTAGTDGGPRKLDLVPSPSVDADIATGSPPQGQFRTVFLGAIAVLILGGIMLIGYTIVVGPVSDDSEPPLISRGSTDR